MTYVRNILLCLALVALGCAPVHTFSPAGSATFEPQPVDYDIVLLDEKPERAHVLVGYVECRGYSVSDVLPYLQKLARKNGGHAMYGIGSTQIYLYLHTYRATVIRYEQ